MLWESAVIIALVSAFAYICAYIYEMAFCNYFGIPHDLISISWTRFLICSLFVFVVAVPLIVSSISTSKKSLVASALVGAVLVFGLSLVLELVGEFSSISQFLIFTILFMIATCYCLVPVLFYKLARWIQKRSKTMRKILFVVVCLLIVLLMALLPLFVKGVSLSHFIPVCILLLLLSPLLFFSTELQQWEQTRKKNKCTMFQALFERIPTFLKLVRIAFLALLPFLVFLLYAYLGGSEAAGGKEYLVPSSNHSMVVLRIYGDKAICAPWVENASGNYTLKEFTIIPVENITIVYEPIGPLEKPK